VVDDSRMDGPYVRVTRDTQGIEMARKTRKDDGHGATVPTGAADARTRRDGHKKRKDGRVKTTQLLPADLAKELAAVAGSEGKERSQVVEDALNFYLSKFVVVKAMRREKESEAAAVRAEPGAAPEATPAGAGQGAGVDPPKGL
jgi:hypothetical protein